MGESDFSYANLANLSLLENLYQNYLKDPSSVEPSWRHFFQGMDFAQSALPAIPSTEFKGSQDLRIYLLIDAYRKFGHLIAHVNPVETRAKEIAPELHCENLGFKKQDQEALFPSCGFLKEGEVSLKTLVDALKKTYCGTVGIEFMGLGNIEMEHWIQHQIEPFFPLYLSNEDKIQILHNLNKAELFESFLHTKYVGQKRFSLEGGETLIPMLCAIAQLAGEEGGKEIVLGMAHRGRLNVLANILNKSYTSIFHEFEDHYTPDLEEGTGDVKYHKGFSGEILTSKGKAISITLVANPSHLEAVDPIVEGIVRARQELIPPSSSDAHERHRKEIIPLLIHGDAAVAGQGVVYETIQLSKLTGYGTGGTLHIVINNQIGFTTLPKDSRSTAYCCEVAKAFGAPVFHVNAEDPEGCVRAANLAIQLRQKFGCDVFINMNCYRKYGHNEGDEPTFTQPLEYALIKNKKSIRELFGEQLIHENVLTQEENQENQTHFKQELQKALYRNNPKNQDCNKEAPQNCDSERATAQGPGASENRNFEVKPTQPNPDSSGCFGIDTTATTSSKNSPKDNHSEISSNPPKQVDGKTLLSLADRFCSVPQELRIHPKIKKLLQDRLLMLQGDPSKAQIDWGMGEHLAFATLLNERIHIRLSGQDVRRGTFSHRHAIWVDQVKDSKYFPLSHLSPHQAPFDVFNSPLSEYAVLGFDFGYSTAYPHSLVLWEAQYGDFANGAQIIIDQFIVCSEQKWSLNSNLTLLLPHGYEGGGPEHSSARIERFLQLCGHQNMRVANCSTPAQFFYLLRSQAYLSIKKPLIIFTPKALLRHPLCVSSLNDFTQGAFQEVLIDSSLQENAKKVFFCSGKMYYELFQEREKRKLKEIALVRIEQLYPFPQSSVNEVLKKHPSAEIYWVQEEHSNMGAWEYIRPFFNELDGVKKGIKYIGRERSAAPAAGSVALHKKQLEQIMSEAFS